MTRKRLYNEIEDKDKIKGLFSAQIFPLTVYILLRSIINKYWLDRFKIVVEVLKDI
jgi:ABC-type uncharacterized transport system fused permease/ATPase subunit